MNSLTSFKKQFVLVTMNGAHYHIDEDEEARLRSLGTNQIFSTKTGTAIRTTTIVEVLPIEEYYKAYPNKKPENSNYTYNNSSKIPKQVCFTKDRAIRAVKSIRSGLIGQINETSMTPEKQTILDKIDARISLLENTPEDKIHLTASQLIHSII